MTRSLFVVHCIDTEGPLHESLDATFDRLATIVGRELERTPQTLERLRRAEIDLGGQEELVRLIVSPQLLDYNDSWDKVDAMLDELLSPGFRQRYADPAGGGWVFNWFAVDHVGFVANPRRRDIGMHNIFDHYRHRLAAPGCERDELQWHFHPAPTYREAHRNATNYLRSPYLFEILARRVLERGWFPSCFRPGFHVERPDSHWFLEQWLPFDFGNQAMPRSRLEEAQADLSGGRFGDWRRAPHDWSHYHPAHDDYQRPGRCRRVLFRCLNVGTRLRLLDREEVRRAFARADGGDPTVLAFTNHDFRDMRPDVAAVHALLTDVAEGYPRVTWRHSGALAAAREVLGRRPDPELAFETALEAQGERLILRVSANHDTFGPQPFLAIKTHSQQFLHDNFDIDTPHRAWSYTFDEQSIRPASIAAVGVAAADANGATAVVRFDTAGRPLTDGDLAAR